MKIRILSDIHNEFKMYEVPPTPADKETVLVLAGDICIAKKYYTYEDFFADLAPRFAHIILISGNHEHYRGNFKTTQSALKANLDQYENVHVLERESIVLDGTAFICATLWTSFGGENPIAIMDAGDMMNDYKVIRNGPDSEPWKYKLIPHDTIMDNRESEKFIFDNIAEYNEQGLNTVVVSHHGPSHQSISEGFRGSPLNDSYVNSYDELIIEAKPNIWIHGHTHVSFNYTIGDTTVICNPRGYYPEGLNPNFDPEYSIEL